MQVLKIVRRAVLATATTAAVVVAATTTAQAAEQDWLWEQAGGNNIGVGAYDDANDVMKVNDQEADDHSLFLDVWKVGAESGVHYRCWDSRGASADGWLVCPDAFAGSGWGVNAQLRGKLCKGEAGGPGGGRLLSCQPSSQWKTFYR
jgi:hypothetical protein